MVARSEPLLAGGAIGGHRTLKKLGRKVSRFFHKDDRKADRARHQYNVDRDRVQTLLKNTGTGPLAIDRPKMR